NSSAVKPFGFQLFGARINWLKSCYFFKCLLRNQFDFRMDNVQLAVEIRWFSKHDILSACHQSLNNPFRSLEPHELYFPGFIAKMSYEPFVEFMPNLIERY